MKNVLAKYVLYAIGWSRDISLYITGYNGYILHCKPAIILLSRL